MPFLYFGTVFIGGLFYPGYNHVTQYASELGSAQALYPWIFNLGMLLVGVTGVAGGVGIARAAATLGGRRFTGMLAGFCLAVFGVSTLMAASFPMPDPRHGAFGMGMAIQLAPFALAASIWNLRAMQGLKTFLIVIGVAMLAMLAVMMGAGNIVRRANVGLFQRIYALTSFPWIAIAGIILARRLRNIDT